MELMSKMMCHDAVYQILASENPTEYPAPMDGPSFSSDISYSSSGGRCTINYGASGSSMSVSNCDCSDPKSYDFYDAGKF